MKLLKFRFRYLLYSLYFNFRVLPLRQAIHLPILCFVKPTIVLNSGKVIIDCNEIKCAMIRVGQQKTTPFIPQKYFVWKNEGTIVFKGRCQIGHHFMIVVKKKGYLEFGDQTGINTGSRIVCAQKIIFNYKVRASWECQFYDNDFHPVIDMIRNKPIKSRAPIILGERVWIGHNSIISKGVKLADGCIVSSGSVVKNLNSAAF